jgi:hypothetical protein
MVSKFLRDGAVAAGLASAVVVAAAVPASAQWGTPGASPYGLSAQTGYPANYGYSGYYDYASGAVAAPLPYAAPSPAPSYVGPTFDVDVTPYYYRSPNSSVTYQYGWHDPAGCGPGIPVC